MTPRRSRLSRLHPPRPLLLLYRKKEPDYRICAGAEAFHHSAVVPFSQAVTVLRPDLR